MEAGDQLVHWLQESGSEKGPHQDRIVEGIGGFASLFRWPESKYKRPCLVTCTDGVGTKVKLASDFERLGGVGQDLVAMCVNDLICTGGDPLLFLDYYAVGKLHLTEARIFLEGVRKACRESDCALVGGETAEMPGLYQGKDFDCAGFAVGVVDEDERWGPHLVQPGDQIIALESSGFHSNGYSLLRQVFARDAKEYIDELLEPTRLYVKPIQKLKALAREQKQSSAIKALAHITGGGLDNLPRILPPSMSARLHAWELPSLFKVVQERTKMSSLEMLQTLNCGVGMMVIVSPHFVGETMKIFSQIDLRAWVCGEVINLKTESGYALEGF